MELPLSAGPRHKVTESSINPHRRSIFNQRTLLKLCNLPPEMQEEVARKMASGDAKEIYDAMAKVYRDRAAATRCWLPLRGGDYRLLHGDFRKVGHEVPSGSVDLILTDAPYESQYLELFEPLPLFASRVLRQGGSPVGIDLDQRSALLLRLPCAIRRFLLAV
jgi:hypothetical protein